MAILSPSGQQPNFVSLQGHPFPPSPFAAVTPSGQHPNAVPEQFPLPVLHPSTSTPSISVQLETSIPDPSRSPSTSCSRLPSPDPSTESSAESSAGSSTSSDEHGPRLHVLSSFVGFVFWSQKYDAITALSMLRIHSASFTCTPSPHETEHSLKDSLLTQSNEIGAAVIPSSATGTEYLYLIPRFVS